MFVSIAKNLQRGTSAKLCFAYGDQILVMQSFALLTNLRFVSKARLCIKILLALFKAYKSTPFKQWGFQVLTNRRFVSGALQEERTGYATKVALYPFGQ